MLPTYHINYFKPPTVSNKKVKYGFNNKTVDFWGEIKIINNEIHFYINNRKILISPVHDVLDSQTLSEWILEDNLNVRLQIQLHKYIWEPDTKGV